MNPDPITEPYREGMRAYAEGKQLNECPYQRLGHLFAPSWRWSDWREGWYQAERENPKLTPIPRKT